MTISTSQLVELGKSIVEEEEGVVEEVEEVEGVADVEQRLEVGWVA